MPDSVMDVLNRLAAMFVCTFPVPVFTAAFADGLTTTELGHIWFAAAMCSEARVRLVEWRQKKDDDVRS